MCARVCKVVFKKIFIISIIKKIITLCNIMSEPLAVSFKEQDKHQESRGYVVCRKYIWCSLKNISIINTVL